MAHMDFVHCSIEQQDEVHVPMVHTVQKTVEVPQVQPFGL